jgi:hypothetical protein
VTCAQSAARSIPIQKLRLSQDRPHRLILRSASCQIGHISMPSRIGAAFGPVCLSLTQAGPSFVNVVRTLRSLAFQVQHRLRFSRSHHYSHSMSTRSWHCDPLSCKRRLRVCEQPTLSRGWTLIIRGWTVLPRGWSLLPRG